MKMWTELSYITLTELIEIRSLQAMWGMIQWRKHTSRELVRCYDLEFERQKMLTPAICRNH